MSPNVTTAKLAQLEQLFTKKKKKKKVHCELLMQNPDSLESKNPCEEKSDF